MVPDKRIVRLVKAYDRDLFIRWNAAKSWFELWLKQPFKAPKLITPVTKSIYDQREPREFTSLDERLLWWLYDADSWRNGGSKKHALLTDSRWLEYQKNADKKRREGFRDLGKDVWQSANSFFTTKDKAKNGKPKFENYKPQQSEFIRPDSKSMTTSRTFSRSKNNALSYNYKKI